MAYLNNNSTVTAVEEFSESINFCSPTITTGEFNDGFNIYLPAFSGGFNDCWFPDFAPATGQAGTQTIDASMHGEGKIEQPSPMAIPQSDLWMTNGYGKCHDTSWSNRWLTRYLQILSAWPPNR